jgi:hypothetical protein
MTRPLVGHLFWKRVCVTCQVSFEQRRAGRPRVTCSPRCYRVRLAERKRMLAKLAPCLACGRRHELELCGAGYLYCSRTETHFLAQPQLELPNTAAAS